MPKITTIRSLMVSEYTVGIFDYLYELEKEMMPNPNYMETQRSLAGKCAAS